MDVIKDPNVSFETVSRNASAYFEGQTFFFSRPFIIGSNFEMAFVVFSAPENFARRKSIRGTWASIAWKMGYPVMFLIGKFQHCTYARARSHSFHFLECSIKTVEPATVINLIIHFFSFADFEIKFPPYFSKPLKTIQPATVV